MKVCNWIVMDGGNLWVMDRGILGSTRNQERKKEEGDPRSWNFRKHRNQ
jgi:hypothetical protein